MKGLRRKSVERTHSVSKMSLLIAFVLSMMASGISSWFLTNNANALSFSQSGSVTPVCNSSSYLTSEYVSYTCNEVPSGRLLFMYGADHNEAWNTGFHVGLSSAIPANSIVTFNLVYQGASPAGYAGANPNSSIMTKLSNHITSYSSSLSVVDSITYYFSSSRAYLDIGPNSVRIFPGVYVIVTGVSYVTLDKEPTYAQLQTIATKIDTLITEQNETQSLLEGTNSALAEINDQLDVIGSDVDNLNSRMLHQLNTTTRISENVLLILRALPDITDAQRETTDAVNDLADQQAKQREEDQQNLDNAQSSADSAGDSSSSDATSAGTTLLAGFQSFVGALTSASASDCKLNMNMGNLNLGDVDLCSLSVPAPLQTLSSIVLIAFCVPLSLATAKKLIGLFRSFQT